MASEYVYSKGNNAAFVISGDMEKVAFEAAKKAAGIE